jgi:hypothetical protein
MPVRDNIFSAKRVEVISSDWLYTSSVIRPSTDRSSRLSRSTPSDFLNFPLRERTQRGTRACLTNSLGPAHDHNLSRRLPTNRRAPLIKTAFLDAVSSLHRTANAARGRNHHSPLRAYAMGNDAPRDPKYKAAGLTFEQFLLVAAALTPNDLHMSWKRPSKMLIRHAQR